MQIAQEKKTSDAQLRASKKYANSKYRPNVFIDSDKRDEIENHFANKGYKSFNEYVIALIDEDMKKWYITTLKLKYFKLWRYTTWIKWKLVK